MRISGFSVPHAGSLEARTAARKFLLPFVVFGALDIYLLPVRLNLLREKLKLFDGHPVQSLPHGQKLDSRIFGLGL